MIVAEEESRYCLPDSVSVRYLPGFRWNPALSESQEDMGNQSHPISGSNNRDQQMEVSNKIGLPPVIIQVIDGIFHYK